MSGGDDAARRLADLGVIPTVYSLVYPETRAAFEAFRMRNDLADMYERAWTKHQDPMHVELFERWKAWSKPVLDVDWSHFPNIYASAGSSEAIRDSVATHTAAQFAAGQAPQLHVFYGEYEGYAAYARAYGCRVVHHDREHYEGSLRETVAPGDRFYLSAPSSLDGNLWSGLERFWGFIGQHLPRMRVALDLCYVGCVGSGPYSIQIDARAVDTVFFSLSKVFGVYYHRIGGVLTRESSVGMGGNVWFKNLFSLRFGAALLERHDVFELARKLRPKQEAIVDTVAAVCGDDVRPSDVALLACQPAEVDHPLDAVFGRPGGHRRYCLTPALDRALTSP